MKNSSQIGRPQSLNSGHSEYKYQMLLSEPIRLVGVIVWIILSEKVHINLCPMLNGSGDGAV